MSGGHDDHKDHGAKKSGSEINIGVTSMIAGFFGVASGTGAMEMYKNGGGGGGGHDHH